MDYYSLLEKIDQGKHEFLDMLEFMNLHTDEETEPIYEWFIGHDEEAAMRFVEMWDCNWETFEDTVYKLADIIDNDEKEKALL